MVKIQTGLAAMAGALALVSLTAIAQAPPPGGPPRAGMGMGMGMMGGPVDKATMIQRLGLDDAALKLSDAQKAQIDKIVDGHVAEQKALREKYPMTPGSPPSQEMMTAMRAARENLNGRSGQGAG